MARLSEWKPYEQHVQSGMVDGQYLNASFCMLASGPPRLANVGSMTFTDDIGSSADQIVFPLGIVQNFGVNQSTQFAQFWEIGSDRSFFIGGHTFGQFNLSRIMYHGPSLLRVLYAYYQDLIAPTVIPSVIGANNIGALTVANAHDVKVAPGYENLYINLASDLFRQPVGLMIYLKDSNEDTFGATYLESCYVPNHGLQTDAQGTVLAENAAIQYERQVPVAVSSLALVGLS